MGLVLTTPPTGEPVSLTTAKNHLRIELTDTSEDDLITALIAAARQEAEETAQASLLAQSWTATFDGFPLSRRPLPLVRGPVTAITSIHYLDPSSADQTMSSSLYLLDRRERSDSVRLAANTDWPATAVQSAAVTVVYAAGYGAATDVPGPLISAMLLRIGDLYRNREAQIIERAVAVQNQAFDTLVGQYVRTARYF